MKMDSKTTVYNAAREGKLKHLKVFLNQREKDLVELLVGAKTNGATPLVMACRNGHYDVAEYLIEKCGANIEQSGSVIFDGDTIGDASPLWCASAAGHLALVKLLVKKGAQVNTPTLTRSTPLRAACFDGYFDIVKLLVNHGADIEIANLHDHTSLMIACFKGHINIVRYLLALNAEVNRKSARGNTALHDGAESGSLEIVKMLIKHGAIMDSDYSGMTPLLTAAITGHRHIVEYFVSVPELQISRQEHIDALELLGATYIDKKRDMVGALELWTQAMAERYHPDHPPMPKPTPRPSIMAYNFAREITSREVLSELNDPDEIRMQALIIRERILGPGHPDTHYCIRYRGAVYADGGQFTRCMELWNYALDVQQSVLEPLDPLTQTSLSNFNDLFSFMLRRQTDAERKAAPLVSREDIFTVFEKAVREVKLGKKMLNKGCENNLQFTKVLMIVLRLAFLSTLDLPEEGSDEDTTLHEAISELARIDFVPGVLHMLYSNQGTSFGRFRSFNFPSTNLVKALIKGGAKVDAKDNDGNTPLHFAAQIHILRHRRDLITTLLEAGAHIDVVNNDGETFETLAFDKRFYYSVKPIKYITLACLAARIVRKTHRLKDVPKHLRSFVQMH